MTAFSSSDYKRMESINSIETYAYRTSKDLLSDKEQRKYKNIMKQYKNYFLVNNRESTGLKHFSNSLLHTQMIWMINIE